MVTTESVTTELVTTESVTTESVPASPAQAPAKAGGPRPSGLAACTGDPDSRPREAAGARTFILRSGRCAQRPHIPSIKICTSRPRRVSAGAYRLARSREAE